MTIPRTINEMSVSKVREILKTGNLEINQKKRYERYVKLVDGLTSKENKPKIISYKEKKEEVHNRRVQSILTNKELTSGQRKVMEEYYKWLISFFTSIDTRRGYLQCVKTLALRAKKEFKELTKEDMQNYFIDSEKKYNLDERTIWDNKRSLRTFFRWLYNTKEDEYPEVVSWISLKKNGKTRLPEDVLTIEEIKEMIRVADNVRDKALLFTLYETGVRRGEFLKLQLKHVQFDKYGAVIYIPQGKTDSRRLRLIDCVPDLKNWYELHPLREDPEAALWIDLGSWMGNALGEDGLKRIIKRYARVLNIPSNKAYTHSFRHARATEMARQGFNESELRIMFGWSKTSDMPSVYIHLAGSDVEEKILRKKGLLKDENELKEDMFKPKICPACKKVNSATVKFCSNPSCNYILDYKFALEVDKIQSEKLSEIEEFLQLPQIKELAKRFLENRK